MAVTNHEIPERFKFLPSTHVEKVGQLLFQVVVAETGTEDVVPFVEFLVCPVVTLFQFIGCQANRLVDYSPGVVFTPVVGCNTSFLLHLLKQTSARIWCQDVECGRCDAVLYPPLHRPAEHILVIMVQTENEQRTARDSLFRARSAYVQAYQPCSFAVDSPLNDEFAGELSILEESELPKYREKIKEARESALEQFQNDFLYKLQSSIEQVQDQVRNLNKALKYAQFGTEQYQFRVDRDPDYAEYYDMIMAPELKNGEGGLFMLEFQNKYSAVIEDLFGKIADSDDTQMNTRRQSELQKNIERYTDFRTYLKFDLETTDREGNKQLLSQTLNKKSGGETQTPFYIAVLASFAQLYQVNNRTPSMSNTVRLVIFDEAFNKMDSDRIVESVRLLRKMNLQAIVCTPPDKISDIMPIADKTLLVHKEKNTMRVLPFAKESADRWNGV